MFALYSSLYRLSLIELKNLRNEGPDHRLDLVQALVNEHIATGQDAIEDWRDIVPDEVKEIEGIERRSSEE